MRDRAFRAQLTAALDHLGEDWHEVELIPFSEELPALPSQARDRLLVCYGPSFVPRVARHTSWAPGVFFDAHRFRWSVMSEHWQGLMFSDGVVTTALEVLEALASGAAPWFVRPDEDSKLFDGGVYADASTFRHHLRSVDLSLPVVKAPPLAVDAEWRCFVVDRQVVDASEYRRAGRPSLHRGAPPRVIELAEQAAARWSPAPVTCIDIASSGDRFGIVEANCFNASRFYAAHAGTVLAAVAALVQSTAEPAT